MKKNRHMIVVRGVLVLMMACTSVQPAGAWDESGKYLILGPGSFSCSTLGRDAADSSLLGIWLTGLLTGVNMMAPQTYNILGGADIASAKVWLQQYCRANPVHDVGDAAQALVFAFLPTRSQTEPATVLPPRPPQAHTSPDLVATVQHLLLLAGFTPGYADGVFGPQTAAALRQYQRRQGLPVTGWIDRATLHALGVSE